MWGHWEVAGHFIPDSCWGMRAGGPRLLSAPRGARDGCWPGGMPSGAQKIYLWLLLKCDYLIGSSNIPRRHSAHLSEETSETQRQAADTCSTPVDPPRAPAVRSPCPWHPSWSTPYLLLVGRESLNPSFPVARHQIGGARGDRGSGSA